MLPWPTVAMLVLQCGIALADDSVSTDNLPVVATINYKGSSLKVFDLEGLQFAEPRIAFGETCDSLRYSYLYQKYQLTLPMSIDFNALESPTEKTKRVGQVEVTDLEARTNGALVDDDKIRVTAQLTRPGEAELYFHCDTFIRCQDLRDDVSHNSEELRRAVKFVLKVRVSGLQVKFGAIASVSPPRITCPQGQWVVFQRREDGGLSFAKNWDAYLKGFGNPESNYWMGLEKLFAQTVTSSKNTFTDSSRCQLRVETEDWRGNHYWAEYNLFEVLGPEQNYRLRIGQEVTGSQLGNFVTGHNEMQFSTHDKDHDSFAAGSCSQLYGYGGWWYGNCHSVNLNGAYTTDKSIADNPVYNTVYKDKFLPMKKSQMKFRCH